MGRQPARGLTLKVLYRAMSSLFMVSLSSLYFSRSLATLGCSFCMSFMDL